MVAIRIARFATKKRHVLKMGGAYHLLDDQHAYVSAFRAAAHRLRCSPFIFKGIDEFFLVTPGRRA